MVDEAFSSSAVAGEAAEGEAGGKSNRTRDNVRRIAKKKGYDDRSSGVISMHDDYVGLYVPEASPPVRNGLASTSIALAQPSKANRRSQLTWALITML